MRPTVNKRILLLVNERANNGMAQRKWAKIERLVMERMPYEVILHTYDLTQKTGPDLLSIIEQEKVGWIISGGGDGTINWILNTLFAVSESWPHLYIGGLGLGSSNDFMKPVVHSIQGIPTRIDFDKTIRNDVGKVVYETKEGNHLTTYFLINASMGVTSDANYFFNHGDRLLNLLKKKMVNLAILYAALHTIFHFHNYSAKLIVDEHVHQCRLTNAGILKSNFFSGGLHYDQDIHQDDGQLGLNYCTEMNKWELLQLLIDLSRGKFSGSPKRWSFLARQLEIQTEELVSLETDGEVSIGRNFHFSLIPGAINTLGY